MSRNKSENLVLSQSMCCVLWKSNLTSRYQFRAWNHSDRDRLFVEKENNKISSSRFVLNVEKSTEEKKIAEEFPVFEKIKFIKSTDFAEISRTD